MSTMNNINTLNTEKDLPGVDVNDWVEDKLGVSKRFEIISVDGVVTAHQFNGNTWESMNPSEALEMIGKHVKTKEVPIKKDES